MVVNSLKKIFSLVGHRLFCSGAPKRSPDLVLPLRRYCRLSRTKNYCFEFKNKVFSYILLQNRLILCKPQLFLSNVLVLDLKKIITSHWGLVDGSAWQMIKLNRTPCIDTLPVLFITFINETFRNIIKHNLIDSAKFWELVGD